MAKKTRKAKNTKRPRKGIKTSNSPTAQLSRKVRKLQRELNTSRAEANALAQDLENALTDIDRLNERVQMLEDDKAKLEVQLAETVPGNNPNAPNDDDRLASGTDNDDDIPF